MMRRLLMITATITVGCGAEPTSTPASATDTDALQIFRQRTRRRPLPTLARPCRQDSIFVDVPLHYGPPWSSLSFVPRLEHSLETEIATNLQSWFCATPGCVGEPVRVKVSSVLPARADPMRGKGHLRFLRVKFSGEESGRALSLIDAGQCDAVQSVRDAVGVAAGVPTDTYWVGRECDAQGAALEGNPTSQMLTWHLEALGLSASAALPPASSPAGLVDLALVDSGVVSAVGSAVQVASAYDAVGTPGLHQHGSGMAILARQLAPQASLHDVRALEASGSGTSEALARGLDHALFSSSRSRPLVLNLSLGWPAELSRTARIQGGTCSSHEDPFGETVRYMLDVARRYDLEGIRPVFISAAAGNRARPVPASLFPPPPTGHVDFSCAPDPAGPSLFFPGEYSRVYSCPVGGSDELLTHATAAVDAEHDPAVSAIANAETPLVAPGQHVMVDASGAVGAPICSAGQAFPPPVNLPASFTGSSVSTVFVSAAAARAQQARLQAGRLPFTHAALERLLYLTGQPLCRSSGSGDPVRELHVARLDQALHERACQELVACAEQSTVSGAALLTACGPALVACGLAPRDATARCQAPGETELGYPTHYQPDWCAVQRTASPAFVENATCSPACPDAIGRSPSLVGSIGPQPWEDGCPSCFVYFRGPLASYPVNVMIELNSSFASGTSITDPWLILKGQSTQGHPKTYYVDLYSVSTPAEWFPGASMKLTVNLASMDLDPSSVKPSLQMQVMTPDAKYSSTDVSPLAPVLEP